MLYDKCIIKVGTDDDKFFYENQNVWINSRTMVWCSRDFEANKRFFI